MKLFISFILCVLLYPSFCEIKTWEGSYNYDRQTYTHFIEFQCGKDTITMNQELPVSAEIKKDSSVKQIQLKDCKQEIK
jgi:hypothetical protein